MSDPGWLGIPESGRNERGKFEFRGVKATL